MTKIRKGQISSGAATDGHVLTADGAGNCDWEAPAGVTGSLEPLTDGNSNFIFANGDVIMA